jgi:hypothetical protein
MSETARVSLYPSSFQSPGSVPMVDMNEGRRGFKLGLYTPILMGHFEIL